VVAVPKAEVVRLLHEHTGVAVALLSALTSVVRQVDDHSTDLVFMDLPGRVAKFLAAAAAAAPRAPGAQPGSRRTDDAVAVDLSLSQTELARLVGGSRQHVNRAIMALEASGAIRREGSRIVSIRPDRLGLAR
jgi:CRP/FNR family cyclic AMP-dependent transcriptional regulator